MSDDATDTPLPRKRARPPRLSVGPFTGSTRSALERTAPTLLRGAYHNMNRIAEAAERARVDKKGELEAKLRDIYGRQSWRGIELTLGKKMSLNVNIRTQEELSETAERIRALPPEKRAELDRALDLFEEIRKGTMLPATALSSATVEP